MPLSLLSEIQSSDVVVALVPLLEATKNANTPFNPEEHRLFLPATFDNGHGQHVLVPRQVDDAMDVLLTAYGDFYTYEELRTPLVQHCRYLKFASNAPSPAIVAASLVTALNDPSDSYVLPPTTFFVPLSGIETRASIPLGTATVVRGETAKTFVADWSASRGFDPSWHPLQEVREIGGAFAQVHVGRATSRRHDEVLRRNTEDAINLLRYWMHHLTAFDQFYNRPHIGAAPPTVHIQGFADAPESNDISTTLYLYSVGVNPLDDGDVDGLLAVGLAEMVGWEEALPGTARFAALRAARRLGHAWSQFDIEDRVLGSFSALDGWLKADNERRGGIGKILGRRLGVLVNLLSPTEQFAIEFDKRIYGPIRSDVAHGHGLNPHLAVWADRVLTNLGRSGDAECHANNQATPKRLVIARLSGLSR